MATLEEPCIELFQEGTEDSLNKSDINLQDASFLSNLIEEIRKYPCIWNVSLKSHKERPKKN